MSQSSAWPSFWAAELSLMNRWTSGGVGTGRVLSDASALPPPPPPPFAPAGCSPPTASAARLVPARTAISSLILRAGRGLNFRACTKRPLWSLRLGCRRGLGRREVPAAELIELGRGVKGHGRATGGAGAEDENGADARSLVGSDR